MQVQPFQTASGVLPQGSPLNPFGGDARIHVPSSNPAPVPPSLFAIFLQEILKRKGLLAVWGIITVILAAALIFKFAKPMYRAEGKLSYIPNYRGGNRPLYNPPNIQTMAQIIKSMDAPESVREKHMPWMPKEEFAKNLHVDVSKMSEFLDVSYDSTDPETAVKIASAVMDESISFFGKYRQTTLKERSAEVKADLERAMADLQRANDEYQKAHGRKGVTDLRLEIDGARTALADEERTLRTVRETESKLKLELAFLKNRQENPGADTDRGFDESFNPILQALQTEYIQKQQTAQVYMTAKNKVDQLRSEEERTRVLAQKGIVPLTEYQKVVAELKSNEAIVKQHEEESADIREAMQKRFDMLKKQILGGKPLRLGNNAEMDRAQKELATIPAIIKSSEEQVLEKRAALNSLLDLQRELNPKDVEKTLIMNRITEMSAQLTDSQYRDKDPNADDLKVAAPASTGGGPYATNVPKLAASVMGISAMLFLGFISIFAVPQAMAVQRTTAAQTQQPRALLAVVPVATNMPMNNPPAAAPEAKPENKPPRLIESADNEMIPLADPVSVSVPTEHEIIIPLEAKPASKPAPAKTVPIPPAKASLLLKDLVDSTKSATLPPAPAPVPAPQTKVPTPTPLPQKRPPVPAPMNEAVQALAKRISQEGVDRGSIVLFTPTQDQLQLTPIIGDLGRQLGLEGNRVLVFDARTAVEIPTWAGPNTPGVAKRVEGFLDGRSEATHCFVPTAMKNVEYSRADLANRVSGVMSAHRFRQLVEEMRERYSLVLMVAPTMALDGNDPLLTALAEGLVLVTESTAAPNQIKAYIDHLAEQVPAPVYGALSVPKA